MMQISPRTAKLIEAALGILLGAAVLEGVLHITDLNNYDKLIVDPASGLTIYRPGITFTNFTTCYENAVSINNIGFHGPPVSPQKEGGTFRIVLLGNSFVEARQVPVDDMLSSALERELNADPYRMHTYEVIPIGFSGNGAFLDLLYYLRWGSTLAPDLVITLETKDDLDSNNPASSHPPQFDGQGKLILSIPKAPGINSYLLELKDKLKDIARRSDVAMNLNNRAVILHSALGELFGHPPFGLDEISPATSSLPSEGDAALWQTERKVLSAYSSEVHKAHARFLLASWTAPLTDPNRAAEMQMNFPAIARESSFSYIDLTDPVAQKEKEEGEPAQIPCDAHWSAAGNRYAAEALSEYLSMHQKLIQ